MKSLDPQVVVAAIPSIIHALLPVIRDWDTEKRVGGTNALNRGVRYKWRSGGFLQWLGRTSLLTIWALSQSMALSTIG